MKRMQLVTTIKKRYVRINKLLKRVAQDFDAKYIHQFRLEVKKLSSFLRMVSTTMPKRSNLKLPEKLHKFYGIMGAIRNLQLQQQSIKGLLKVEYFDLQDTYLSFIKTEIDEQIMFARRLVKDKKPFANGRKKLLEHLPSNLKQKFIRKFTLRKLKAIVRLMQPSWLSDESLHAIRKLLKDILYTWSFTKERTAILSLVAMRKKDISSIAKILGEYQDRCVGLDLLHMYSKKQEDGSRQRILWRRLENKRWSEKESARKDIYKVLHQGFLLQLKHL